MKCSVYIATSVDGFIAKHDGSIDWLETAGNPDAGTGGAPYIDMTSYMATVDCMIMGRKSMEMISGFNLKPEQWPYGSTRIIVLSKTVKEPPKNLRGKVEMYSDDLSALVAKLENEGHQHAYIDGGITIQAFINLKLINEMTITQIPILLGEGKSLFGRVSHDIRLENARAVACPSDYVQVHYTVSYQ
jgi:dihydrofolate reductase